MRISEDNYQFSPSIFHNDACARNEPRYSFRGGALMEWQQQLRARVIERLGYYGPLAPRVDLQAQTLWKRDIPLGSIEKIVFRSQPCVDVPAYMCLPRGVTAPPAVFICLQGHSTGMHNSIAVDYDDEIMAIPVAGDRDFALGCLAQGIGALCIEQRSFGYRRETAQPGLLNAGCHHAAMTALMLGTTLLAERVFDVDRGIDYLAQRGDVDMARIGVMGNSGGGTTSMFAGALLSRIRYCMPSCCLSTFRESIMAMYHCVCNFVPGLLLEAEMADICGLIAPKSLVLVSGRNDDIFPLQAACSEFTRLQEIYKKAGAAGRCHHVIGEGGHQFYARDAWPVMIREMRRDIHSPSATAIRAAANNSASAS